MSGLQNDQIVGKMPKEIFPRDFARGGVAHDRKVIRERRASTRESRFDTVDGPRVFVTNKFPIFNQRGKVNAIGTIHTDITERKRARRN